MRILGIDPGLSHLGYGVIDVERGRLCHRASGVVTTEASDSLGARLLRLHRQVLELIVQHRPDVVALERQIYCQNVQTAMTLGQVQGIVTLAAEQENVDIWSTTPRELKQALAGKGQASKLQVSHVVARLLSLNVTELSEHAADALAAAVAYSNRAAMEQRLARIDALSGRRQP